jgi:hypothetical protein
MRKISSPGMVRAEHQRKVGQVYFAALLSPSIRYGRST